MKKVLVPLQAENNELIPIYSTAGASGADVRANIVDPVVIEPGTVAIIPTGLKVEIPVGYEIQVRPRSGLAAKNGVTVLNTPGTIDADYRGEIKVLLINLSDQVFEINTGDRIAQMVVAKHEQVNWEEVEVLNETTRGVGGYGHTGVA